MGYNPFLIRGTCHRHAHTPSNGEAFTLVIRMVRGVTLATPSAFLSTMCRKKPGFWLRSLTPLWDRGRFRNACARSIANRWTFPVLNRGGLTDVDILDAGALSFTKDSTL